MTCIATLLLSKKLVESIKIKLEVQMKLSLYNSIVDIVEFKNGWYNNPKVDKDDDKVLEEYRQFKHNNHTSWLFDQ